MLRSAHGNKEIVWANLAHFCINEGDSVMNQLGKRFKCQACGTEVLCTKAGEGSIICCSKEMELQEAKPLPYSD